MKWLPLVALVALVACGHHTGESEYPREKHPCDPKGADVAHWQELPELERDLMPDEIALRGTCSASPRQNEWRVQGVMDEIERESMMPADCSGACKAMEAGLPALDRAHDLEDETLQRECTAAVTKLDAKIRSGCRHVCLVERRDRASKAIFARVMRGLWSFDGKLPNETLGDVEVRRLWHDAEQPLPPKRFVLGATDKVMTAAGAYYPGGPLLRLRLVQEDAGCGQSEWGVNRW